MTIEDLMAPFGLEIDLRTGDMAEPYRYVRRTASDMRGYYADTAALERMIEDGDDPLHYEVFEAAIPAAEGHLLCGISKLQPGRVGEECFMTKGHFHEKLATAEVYLCLAGMGYMLMKTPDGKRCTAEPMSRGQMVYVPPSWAHRSINAGAEPLVTFYVYPADAGHNYGDIATEGFPRRVFVRRGRVVVEEVG